MRTLPAHLERIGTDLERAARAQARRRVRRAQRAKVALALVVVVGVGAGATLAARGLDVAGAADRVVGWALEREPSSAPFSVDPGAVDEADAPAAISCTRVRTAVPACEPGSDGPWVYDRLQRVPEVPTVSRDDLHARIGEMLAEGAITAETAARARADVDAVRDEFLVELRAMLLVLALTSEPMSSPRGPVVPPDGVPPYLVCRSGSDRERTCTDLAGARGVPVGTPLYALRVDERWQPAGQEQRDEATSERRALEDVLAAFSFNLTAPERRIATALARSGAPIVPRDG